MIIRISPIFWSLLFITVIMSPGVLGQNITSDILHNQSAVINAPLGDNGNTSPSELKISRDLQTGLSRTSNNSNDINDSEHKPIVITEEMFKKWDEAARFNKEELSSESNISIHDTEFNSLLKYMPWTDYSTRHQGDYGNCWVWACTAAVEISHNYNTKKNDILSIGYVDTYYKNQDKYAGQGGFTTDFMNFYNSKSFGNPKDHIFIPWKNTNADYRDFSNKGTIPAYLGDISLTPNYPFTGFEFLPNPNLDDSNSVNDYIKNNIDRGRAVTMYMYFPDTLNEAGAFDDFNKFWNTEKDTIYDPNKRKNYPIKTASAHMMLIVGYNELTNCYTVLNSWGTNNAHPDGTFEMQIEGTDYSWKINNHATMIFAAIGIIWSNPTASSITPSSAANTGPVTITDLVGTNFQTGAIVNLIRASSTAMSAESDSYNISATSVNVQSSTKISCTFPITGAPPGIYNVVVTNPDGQSVTLSNGFTITGTNPVIDNITPSTGSNTGPVSITNLAGMNFQSGATVKLTKTGSTDIYATGVSVSSSSKIVCTFPITGASTGTWNVVVTNPDQKSVTFTNGFTINSGPPASPSNPVHAGTIKTGENGASFAYPRSVYVVGNYAYIVGGNHLFEIVDVSIPTAPAHKGNLDETGDRAYSQNVYVSGNYAYVTCPGSNTLEIVDVSNPTAPVRKSNIVDGGGGGAKLSSPQTVYVVGTYAYVASKNSNALEILDISNPAAPVHKSSISITQPLSVFISGTYAYVVSQENKTLDIIDVSNPAVPVHNGSIKVGQYLWGLYVSGNYAYVIYPYTLQIIDVSNPTAPALKGTIVDGEGGAVLNTPTSVYVAGNYAFVTGDLYNSLEIVDISNPNDPVHKGKITNGDGGACIYKPTSVYVTGNYAYVVGGSDLFGARSALEIVKIGSNPAPSISGITPSSAANIASVSVTNLAGANFQSGATVKLTKAGSSDILATSVSVTATKITCVLPITGKTGGSWNVVVTNPDGQAATLENAFTITVPVPVIMSISPSTAPNTGNQIVSIFGTEFHTGAVVNLTDTSYSISGTINSITSNTIKCTFPLTGAPTRSYNLSVRNLDGSVATKTNAFTVTNSSPAITAVSPATGFNITNTNLTITGSSFRNGITAKLIYDNFTLDGTDLVKTDTTKVQYTFATLGQPAGKYNLTLTNIDGSTVTKSAVFELKSPSNNPNITSTLPWTGKNNAAIPITITGSNFRGPTSTTFTGISVTLTNETLGTTITGTPTSKKAQKTNTLYYTLPLTGKPAGIYNLTVRNYDGSFWTNTSGFIINTTDPTISKISPTSGYTTKDQPVTITGTNFRTGAGVTLTNGSIPYDGSGVTVVSPTSLTCSFLFASDNFTDSGKYNVTVTNTDGTSGTLGNAFTVIAPANSPVISTITPTVGFNNAGKAVTITGNNFSKPTVTITNGTVSRTATATTGKTQKSTTLYYTLPLTGLEPGSYLVTVTNSNGTSDTISFFIDPTTPTIKTISPIQGYTIGDTMVTITGTNYRPGVMVNLTNLSTVCPATTKTVTSSQITCTVPTTEMMGIYNVTVTNDDPTNEYNTNVTKNSGFTVSNPGTDPTITRITPNSSPNSAAKAVTITGTNFRGPASTAFTGIKVTITNETLGTTITGTPTPKKAHLSTTLYYTLPLTGVPAGIYNLIVTNYDGSSITRPDFFTVTTTNPTIVIDSKSKKEKISPVSAFNTSSVNVTIQGTNFRDGVKVNLTNPSTPVVEGLVITRTNTQILSQFPLSGKPAGKYTLTICNADGTNVTAKTLFEVKKPGSDPVISSITPASAFNTGNLAVTITGKYFNKPTVYITQGDLTKQATATAKKTSTTTVLYVTLPLTGVPGGLYDLTVRNADGVNTTAEGVFWVTDKASVSSIHTSPVVGNSARMPVGQVPQILRPAGTGTSTGSLVVVPRGPVVVKG